MKLATVLAGKGPQVFTIRPDQAVQEAVEMLGANNIGALVAVDEHGGLLGILSERDLIRELGSGTAVLRRRVAEVMTTSVTAGTLDDDVEPVLARMTGGHFRHLPIVDDGRLIGLLTTADLVQAQMVQLQGTVETLETRLMDEGENQP